MIKNLFKKTFNIHEGETRIALLMQLYIFLIITTLLLIKPTVTAVFLSELGSEKLPYGYLLVAVVAIVTSFLYNWLNKRFSIKTIAVSTIILFAFFFAALSYFIHNEIFHNSLLYFYYVSISMFGVLVTSQFWVIANVVFDLREAKRLFGFIGAGAIAGGIFGGYLTSLLAKYFGSDVVVLVATIVLLSSLPIILAIWRIRVDQLNKYIKAERKEKVKKISKTSLNIVFKSKHLMNLSFIVGVSVLVAKLVDYQFSDLSHKIYTDPDDLASFFGFWFSSFNIISLVIQLFLTNRLLARFGVSKNLLLLPFGLFIGSFLFFIFPELWIMILIKGVDGSFKQSINKASFELSILPVSYEAKKQAKPFIDVVVDSIATGAAGFLLLFIIKKFDFGTSYISLLILFFLLIWFFLIYRLRKSYFDVFRKNISEIVKSDKKKKKKKKAKNQKYLNPIHILQAGSDQEIINLLRHLNTSEINVYKSHIINLLDHSSDSVKVEAIREVHDFENKKVFKKITNLLEKNTNDEVVYEAMEYLLAHSATVESKTVMYYLDHKKNYIRNVALLCLAKSSRHNKVLGEKYDLTHRIEKRIEEFANFDTKHGWEDLVELLLTIGYSGKTAYYSFIDKYLSSDNPVIVKYAIKAAGLTRQDSFIEKLIHLMPKKTYHDEVLKALKQYGQHIVNELYSLDEDEVLDDKTRGMIPALIESFKTKKSLVLLLRLLKSKNVSVRMNAALVLEKLKNKDIKLKLSSKRISDNIFEECLYFKSTLTAISSIEDTKKNKEQTGKNGEKTKKESQARKSLLDYLQKQLDYSLETIFNLLSIKYTESDMKVSFLGLKNDTEKSRINTVEFLSNLLEYELKDELLPLLEYHFLSEKETKLKIEILPENKVLTQLINERGAKTKHKVLNLIQYLNNPLSSSIIKELTKHNNTKVSSLAKTILED